MDKNEELLNAQGDWVDTVLRHYWLKLTENNAKNVCVDQDKILSHPFYMGLSDKYIINAENKTRIMIIGREAMGYGKICDGTAKYDFIDSCSKKCEENKNLAENSQRWAISYLEKQVYGTYSKLPDCYGKISRNTSPFWNLFRWFDNSGFVTCWNNIDKVYFSQTGKLSYDAKEELSKPYSKNEGKEEKSLLQREIEIAEPNVILFVTGATYFTSMQAALKLKEPHCVPEPVKEVAKCLVKLTSEVTDIPIYWTDHPQCLAGKHFKKQDFIENIIEKLI